MSNHDDATDIEHLKQNKMFLPTLGADANEPAPTEAFGGSDDAPALDMDDAMLREHITGVLKDIYDPEIPVNIYDLGLIYGFDVSPERDVDIRMTLTAPACPVAGMLVKQVADRVGELPGVRKSHVELVWDPPWTPDRMTEEAKLELGMY